MPWSRRRALTALASGAATALAGCGALSTDSTDSQSESPSEVSDYEFERVRDGDGAVLFSERPEQVGVPDASPDGTVTDDRPGGRPPGASRRHAATQRHYLTAPAQFEELTFADIPDAQTLRSFTAETDFEGSSVFLQSMPVSACYEYYFQGVEVDVRQVSTQYCRSRRPADVACDADALHTLGFAVRLPFPGDENSGVGTRKSSSCGRPDRPPEFDADAYDGSADEETTDDGSADDETTDDGSADDETTDGGDSR